MKQGQVSLRTQALNMLIDAGTWVAREELDTLSTCPPVVDDVLADLVTEGAADYREGSGYRLAGSVVVRRAAQLQRRSGRRVAAVGRPGADAYHVGVAEERAELGLLMYEMAIPTGGQTAPLADHLRAMNGVVDFIQQKGGSHGGAGV